MELTLDNFKLFQDFVYQKSGLFFTDKKLYLVKKRIEKRMAVLELDSVQEYYRFLKRRDERGKELDTLLNILTTNETYFFREFEQLQSFAENCLSEVCGRKNLDNDRKIRLWCAGCSTGEEAYTLMIILLEMLPNLRSWDVEVFATDINHIVLDKAEMGVYEERSIRNVPPKYLEEYFVKNNGNYHVNEDLKNKIQFSRHNLFDQKEMESMKDFDFIFCRNVLIYFDTLSQKKVVSNFYDSLNTGGYIFLGHSEAMSRISSSFKIKKMGGIIVYQKGEE